MGSLVSGDGHLVGLPNLAPEQETRCHRRSIQENFNASRDFFRWIETVSRLRRSSATGLFLILCGSIFAGEALVMLLLARWSFPSRWNVMLLDATLLLVALFPVLYLLVFRPLTRQIEQRERAERAVHSAHALRRIAARAARLGGWAVDMTVPCVVSSEELRELFEAPTGEDLSVEQALETYCVEPWRDVVLRHFSRCCTEGTPFDTEVQMVSRTGRQFWARIVGDAERDGAGRIVRIHGALQDLTEQKRAEGALRKSEEKFRSLFNNAQVGMLLTRLDGSETLDANDQFLRILKRTREETVGAPSRIYWSNPAERAKMVRRLRADGRVSDFEFDLINNEGAIRRCVMSLQYAHEEGVIEGSIYDITERQRASDALRASEQDFRSLAEAMPQIVWATRPDGYTTYFNNQWVEYTGLTLEESYGHLWNTPFHPDDRKLAWDAWQHSTRFGWTYAVECRLRRFDGQYRWFLIRSEPLRAEPHRGERGEILKWFGTCTDIHDIKLTEVSLRERESDLAEAQAIAAVGSWKYDAATDKPTWSQEMFRIFGLDPVDGEPPWGVHRQSIHPDHWQQIDDAVQVAMISGIPYREQFRIVRPDGSLAWAETIGRPERDAGGEIIGLSGVVQDITARKQAEEDKATLEAQLQQSQKMESVGLLAGGVAHDFNNMLGVILGYSEMAIAQVDAAQPLHEDLLEIRGAAIRSADLTRQLLAFARQQTITPTVLDLNETVPDMLAMLQRLIGEDISILWHPATALWPVLMDPSQMDQILTNVCVNARHAIAGVGTVTITTANAVADAAFCAVHAEAVPGDYVQLSVRDTGSGMDAETRARIFEPFFSTKGVGAGTGLGLATVYGALKQNQGFVTVASTLGEGTTFEIYLPRYRGALTPAPQSEAVAADLRGGETILLVEDEPALIRFVTKALEAQGYVMLAASSAADALHLAAAHAGEIHLLVSDVVMPERNGRDLATALLKIRPTLKPLFMSGHTADVIASRGLLAPGVAFIEKPFTPLALAAKVREVLDRQ
jgi:PAS domain S-box-containing protein